MKVALINHTPLAIPVHAMGKCYGVNTTEQSLVRAVSSGHLSLLEHAMHLLILKCLRNV